MQRFLSILAYLGLAAFATQAQSGDGRYLIGNIEFDPASCTDGQPVTYKSTTKTFGCVSPAVGGIPPGSILLTLAEACPAGFTESSTLSGKTLLGTLAAAKDVGGAGGSDAITPTGSNSAPALSMNAYTPSGTNGAPPLTMNAYTPAGTNGAPTFTGTQSTAIVNHTHYQQMNTSTSGSSGNGFPALLDSSTSGGPTALWVQTGNPVSGGAANYTPAGTVAAPAFTGTQATLTGKIAAPSFTGTQATLTGSVAAPTFTGTQFDNRSAYVKVIFCVKD